VEFRPIALSFLASFALVACSSGGDGKPAGSPAPEDTGAQMSFETKGKPLVVLTTSLGDITVELYPDKAPISVENFLQYVKDGFYDGTVFHRVVPGFVIQGGGFSEDGKQKKTRSPIENEAKNGLKNERGTLSMARTSDVNSATSQFFVNLVDNEFLDHGVRDYGYAVFAKVTDGMDVVDAIAAVPTGDRSGHQDVPVDTVRIVEVTIDE